MKVSEVLTAVNSLTPLGVIGLLAFIVYLLVAQKGPMRQLTDNHLHDLPEMAASIMRIERTLGEIRDGINYLKGRIR